MVNALKKFPAEAAKALVRDGKHAVTSSPAGINLVSRVPVMSQAVRGYVGINGLFTLVRNGALAPPLSQSVKMCLTHHPAKVDDEWFVRAARLRGFDLPKDASEWNRDVLLALQQVYGAVHIQFVAGAENVLLVRTFQDHNGRWCGLVLDRAAASTDDMVRVVEHWALGVPAIPGPESDSRTADFERFACQWMADESQLLQRMLRVVDIEGFAQACRDHGRVEVRVGRRDLFDAFPPEVQEFIAKQSQATDEALRKALRSGEVGVESMKPPAQPDSKAG